MGKKKSKAKNSVGRQTTKAKVQQEFSPGTEETPRLNVSKEQQQVAVERLTKLFKAMSSKPEPILKTLERLGISYTENEDSYIIRKADLAEGEKHNVTIFEKLYGSKFPEPEPESVATPDNSPNFTGPLEGKNEIVETEISERGVD